MECSWCMRWHLQIGILHQVSGLHSTTGAVGTNTVAPAWQKGPWGRNWEHMQETHPKGMSIKREKQSGRGTEHGKGKRDEWEVMGWMPQSVWWWAEIWASKNLFQTIRRGPRCGQREVNKFGGQNTYCCSKLQTQVQHRRHFFFSPYYILHNHFVLNYHMYTFARKIKLLVWSKAWSAEKVKYQGIKGYLFLFPVFGQNP